MKFKIIPILLMVPMGLLVSCSGSETPAEKEKEKPDAATAIDMVFVEGGSFQMGCHGEKPEDCYENELPVHKVKVNSFYIGKREITQGQYKALMGKNPSYFSGCDSCPVEKVTWNDAMAYIKKLNEKTGLKYRLPTEAEWEFAARGGNKSKGAYYAGHHEVEQVAWFTKNSGDSTHACGLKMPNELGIHDMSGNVWEWCSDLYSLKYYVDAPEENPTGPKEGDNHSVRGGSWENHDLHCRVSSRLHEPDEDGDDIGFRVVRTE